MSRNHGESWMQRFIDRFPRCLQQETLGTPPTTPGSPQGKEGIDKPLRPDTTCIDDKDVYSLTKKINLCTNAKKLNQKRGGTAAAAHGGRRSSTRNTSERSHVLAHMLSMLCEREAGVGRSGSGIYTPHWVEEEDVTGSEAGGDGEEKREIRGGGVVPLRSPNTGGGGGGLVGRRGGERRLGIFLVLCLCGGRGRRTNTGGHSALLIFSWVKSWARLGAAARGVPPFAKGNRHCRWLLVLTRCGEPLQSELSWIRTGVATACSPSGPPFLVWPVLRSDFFSQLIDWSSKSCVRFNCQDWLQEKLDPVQWLKLGESL
jgi:hypothetical protein